MELKNIDTNQLTPMMQQYAKIKQDNLDKIIFFRLGEFYEMFFEDAILTSRLLEIALTSKNAGLKERVPMCGVPVHSYQTYLEKLVDLGYKVAVVEQLEEAGKSKLVDRGIVLVVTPGTIIKDDINNNLIAGYIATDNLLACLNIATGEVFCMVVENLLDTLVKYDIKEVVSLEPLQLLGSYTNSIYKITNNYANLMNNIDKSYSDVVNLLLSYVGDLYEETLVHFKNVVEIKQQQFLQLDYNAIHTLELVKSMKSSQKFGTLFWYLDNTSTSMGSRKLKQWILNPLLDIEQIKIRQNYVKVLVKEFILLNDLQGILKGVYDLERICAKLSVKSVNARDLIWLNSSLKQLPKLNQILQDLQFDLQVDEFSELVTLLDRSLNEDAPTTLKAGKIIRYGYNANLDELKDINDHGMEWLLNLEQTERTRTNIKNLKIKYNKVFGYFIEVSNANLHLIKPEYNYERKQTLSNSERFITEELKTFETKLLNASDRLVRLEYDLFVEIRDFISEYLPRIQACANVISEVDCYSAFAHVASRDGLVCPSFNQSNYVKITSCKHPVVAKSINDLFVENDIMFTANEVVMLITGPNMSGKSTYMRQMALCVIMAQIGSFVACSSADLMVFDAIYTRIGARDDLSSGKSTFMVEMLEANKALQNATSNSLLLFDELGRGTSTYDGISICHAIIEYISNRLQAKTMFSTHYHELTSLASDQVFNVNASVIEEAAKIIFKHKIESGYASKSYGVYVASLAGLPNEIIEMSNLVLAGYEKQQGNNNIAKIEYVEVEHQLIADIRKIDVNKLTPIEGLNVLSELVNKSK